MLCMGMLNDVTVLDMYTYAAFSAVCMALYAQHRPYQCVLPMHGKTHNISWTS